jgi:hypothetical protein
MKLTTIALAIAFALPSTFALARGGGMSFGNHGARSFTGTTAGAAGRIATKPMNASGNTLGIIPHNPSGSTLTPPAMNRGVN